MKHEKSTESVKETKIYCIIGFLLSASLTSWEAFFNLSFCSSFSRFNKFFPSSCDATSNLFRLLLQFHDDFFYIFFRFKKKRFEKKKQIALIWEENCIFPVFFLYAFHFNVEQLVRC